MIAYRISTSKREIEKINKLKKLTDLRFICQISAKYMAVKTAKSYVIQSEFTKIIRIILNEYD
jgi:hypothetical protein